MYAAAGVAIGVECLEPPRPVRAVPYPHLHVAGAVITRRQDWMPMRTRWDRAGAS